MPEYKPTPLAKLKTKLRDDRELGRKSHSGYHPSSSTEKYIPHELPHTVSPSYKPTSGSKVSHDKRHNLYISKTGSSASDSSEISAKKQQKSSNTVEEYKPSVSSYKATIKNTVEAYTPSPSPLHTQTEKMGKDMKEDKLFSTSSYVPSAKSGEGLINDCDLEYCPTPVALEEYIPSSKTLNSIEYSPIATAAEKYVPASITTTDSYAYHYNIEYNPTLKEKHIADVYPVYGSSKNQIEYIPTAKKCAPFSNSADIRKTDDSLRIDTTETYGVADVESDTEEYVPTSKKNACDNGSDIITKHKVHSEFKQAQIGNVSEPVGNTDNHNINSEKPLERYKLESKEFSPGHEYDHVSNYQNSAVSLLPQVKESAIKYSKEIVKNEDSSGDEVILLEDLLHNQAVIPENNKDINGVVKCQSHVKKSAFNNSTKQLPSKTYQGGNNYSKKSSNFQENFSHSVGISESENSDLEIVRLKHLGKDEKVSAYKKTDIKSAKVHKIILDDERKELSASHKSSHKQYKTSVHKSQKHKHRHKSEKKKPHLSEDHDSKTIDSKVSHKNLKCNSQGNHSGEIITGKINETQQIVEDKKENDKSRHSCHKTGHSYLEKKRHQDKHTSDIKNAKCKNSHSSKHRDKHKGEQSLKSLDDKQKSDSEMQKACRLRHHKHDKTSNKCEQMKLSSSKRKDFCEKEKKSQINDKYQVNETEINTSKLSTDVISNRKRSANGGIFCNSVDNSSLLTGSKKPKLHSDVGLSRINLFENFSNNATAGKTPNSVTIDSEKTKTMKGYSRNDIYEISSSSDDGDQSQFTVDSDDDTAGYLVRGLMEVDEASLNLDDHDTYEECLKIFKEEDLKPHKSATSNRMVLSF